MADVAVRGLRHRGDLAVIVRPFGRCVQKPVTIKLLRLPRHGGAQGNAALLRAPHGATDMPEPKTSQTCSGAAPTSSYHDPKAPKEHGGSNG